LCRYGTKSNKPRQISPKFIKKSALLPIF